MVSGAAPRLTARLEVVDVALPRPHRQLDAGHGGDLRRARAGRVDHPAGIDDRAIGQAHAGQRGRRRARAPRPRRCALRRRASGPCAGTPGAGRRRRTSPRRRARASRRPGHRCAARGSARAARTGSSSATGTSSDALHRVVVLERRQARHRSPGRGSRSRRSRPRGTSPSTARYRSRCLITSTPKRLISMLSGVLNCSRMLAAESVVEEVRKVGSRSTTTIRPSKSGRAARKVATAEPMMAPPTMTTSARSRCFIAPDR